MSQEIFNNIDPAQTSGIELSNILNLFKDALASGFSGTSRPANLQAGGLWVDNSTNPLLVLSIFDGTASHTIASVDTSTGFLTIPNLESISINTGSINYLSSSEINSPQIYSNNVNSDDISAQNIITNNATINDTLSAYTINVQNLNATNTVLGAVTESEDASIVLNKGGTKALADAVNSGFEVDMSDATNFKLGFDSTKASKIVAGEVGNLKELVDVSTVQTITNKNIKSPVRAGVKEGTFSSLTTYASTADNGQLCFSTDTKKMYHIVDGALVEVGSGGGGLSYNKASANTWNNRNSPDETKSWVTAAYGTEPSGVPWVYALANSGTGGRVVGSQNGVNWNTRTTTDRAWTDIVFGGGRFVAVAASFSLTSSDGGYNWTESGGMNAGSNKIAYGNGKFVTAGATGASPSSVKIRYSTDGLTWNTPTLPNIGMNTYFSGVVFGNGIFMVSATGDEYHGVFTSPDGITWTYKTGTEMAAMGRLVFAKGKFYSYEGTTLRTSTDGTSWTTVTTTLPNLSSNHITYANGIFISVGSWYFATSLDGISWNRNHSPTFENWQKVIRAWDNMFFSVSGGGIGRFATSKSLDAYVD